MITRLRGLFQRYARQHRHIEMPGFSLAPDGRAPLGHVDRTTLSGSRLQLTGWSMADRVMLVGSDGRAAVRPGQVRHDVAEVHHCPPEVGFELSLPFGDGRFSVITERDGVARRRDIAPLTVAALRRERLRLAARFGRTLLATAPQLFRAALRHDPAARTMVKDALGLKTITEGGMLAGDLFLPEGMAPPAATPVAVTLIMPVYNAFDLLPEVLDRVARHTDLPWHLVLVEDCSSDDRVRPWLRDWATAQNAVAADRVELVEHEVNRGFIAAANAGLARAVARGEHAILLNSDAFVPAGWASRLMRPILKHERVASVTPMSNDAEIFSVPAVCERQPLQPGQGDAIDAWARRIHPDSGLVDCPTGVGFCMALNIDYLRKIPALDTSFGRGYGEEVDWCQKIRARGGRHLGLPSLFVEHRGGESFGSAEKLKLVLKNNKLIEQRYRGYDAEVLRFATEDPLVTPRLALALAWAVEAAGDQEVPIFLAHSMGGGAEKYLERRIATEMAPAGRPAVVLRVGGVSARWQLEVISPAGKVAGCTDDFELVEQLLAPVVRRRIVYSCGVGDSDPLSLPAHLLRLRRGPQDAVEILVHDFFMLSPSYTLLGDDGHFRGALVAGGRSRAHSVLRADGRIAPLEEWRDAWARLMGAATEVVTFSASSRALIRQVYPGIGARVKLRPHELLEPVARIEPPRGGRRVVGVLGNIGYQKGAAVVAEMGRRLAAGTGGRAGPDLVLVGNVDPAYMPPASVPIHGDYRLEDLPGLVARYGITDWLVPSIWPETFSFTTHEALATGMPVYAFDIGAQGEAVTRAENGHVIPYSPDADLAGSVLDALIRPAT